jgi:cytidylate kinase
MPRSKTAVRLQSPVALRYHVSIRNYPARPVTFRQTGDERTARHLAIITISHQHGTRGDALAAGLARELQFTLVTPEKVDEIIRVHYQLDYSLSGESGPIPRMHHRSKVFASLISAILTDMAVLHDLVVFECGGQFIFRAFPNALHTRIVAARDIRAHNIMQDTEVSFDQAIKEMEEHHRKTGRFLRSTFRRPSEPPERYDLVINAGRFDMSQSIRLILLAVREKKLAEFGMVSNENAERSRVRHQIRLVRSLTKLTLDSNPSLMQFAHPSEMVFARLLDFYGIRWEYEPRTFPLSLDGNNNITEAFSPDFYLPDSDLYVELTTMKQSLVTKKNRKVRRLRELYPDIKIRLLYQKDFEDLLFKYATKSTRE